MKGRGSMICPDCFGRSRFPPCLTCAGHGIVHCCDGLREQHDDDDGFDAPARADRAAVDFSKGAARVRRATALH
jgi:hypothetical protein